MASAMRKMAVYLGLVEDHPHHGVELIMPVPALFQPPAIHHIAHQIEMVAIRAAEKIDQKIAAAPSGAEMKVRNEDAAVACLGPGMLHVRLAYLFDSGNAQRFPLPDIRRTRHVA